jgi:hypothetical protein
MPPHVILLVAFLFTVLATLILLTFFYFALHRFRTLAIRREAWPGDIDGLRVRLRTG